MATKRASEIVKGDELIFTASNGRTRCRVQAVEEGSEEDLLPPDTLKNPKPMVRIHVFLQRAVWVPDMPRAKTVFWTLWHYPDDELELCYRDVARP